LFQAVQGALCLVGRFLQGVGIGLFLRALEWVGIRLVQSLDVHNSMPLRAWIIICPEDHQDVGRLVGVGLVDDIFFSKP
jgi:hypothetical protein